MDDRTRQTVEQIKKTATLDALDVLFAGEMRAHGFNNYATGVLSSQHASRQFLLMRWPRWWLERYAAEGFAQDDALLVEALRAPRTFTWHELMEEQPGAGARVFAACAASGWIDGLTIPVHGPGSERGIVSLASANRVDLTPEARRAVEIISLAAYLHARELADDPPHRDDTLSARECETLTHVANGLNDAEIATILGISRTTAHTHVERAKEKLGAATRAHAVAVAMMRGVI
jgi:DNA-binding CsgD family transcriptional regulator